MNEANFIIAFIGPDLPKRKLGCAALRRGKIRPKVVSNDPPKFSVLNAWLKDREIHSEQAHLCMDGSKTL